MGNKVCRPNRIEDISIVDGRVPVRAEGVEAPVGEEATVRAEASEGVEAPVGEEAPDESSVEEESSVVLDSSRTSVQYSDFRQHRYGGPSTLVAVVENKDFSQQCYDGRSQLQLQTPPVRFRDNQQQCYDGGSRPTSSMRAVIQAPPIFDDGYHPNTFELVIRIAKELESILEVNYEARGLGLGEKVCSVAKKLPSGAVNKIKKINGKRNKLVHKVGYNDLDPDVRSNIIETFEDLKRMLNREE